MAKKSRAPEKPSAPVVLSAVDKKTLNNLRGLASRVEEYAAKNKAPFMEIRSRSLSNVRFNAKQKIIELLNAKTQRELFNLSQAKSFMQTLLVGSGFKKLIEQGKTASIRQIFYLCKHTIKGTSENTFDEQSECDPIIEDVEVMLNSLREELHVFASNRGTMVGNITINDSGDVIDCSRMGSGGYSIPSIVEPEIIQFEKYDADFILHVEKDTVWRRFNEDKFWKTHNCILTHGGGQPPRGVRRLLSRLHNELKLKRDVPKLKLKKGDPLPVYCVLDNDPWGYYIYSVIKQGSINLAYESQRMAIPGARYLGLRSRDYADCELPSSTQIKLSEQDIKRAKQIADYPWFKNKPAWQKEIEQMLKNGFKLEVESLISKDISYVTEEYVPERLESGEFLD